MGVLINMPDDEVRRQITKQVVARLWNVLEHPPLSYVGEKYQYRQPDGSHNVSPVSVC